MNKTSFLFWLLFIGVAFLVSSAAFSPLPATFAVGALLGMIAFFLLSVALIIGPAVVFWPKTVAPILEARRAVGLTAFTFMLAHFIVVFLTSFGGNIGIIFQNVQTLVAVPAILIFFAMALTSSDWAIRTMGNPNWKLLHRFVYVGFVLILVHYFYMGSLTAGPPGTPINFAEVFLWIFAGVAIIMQVAGFIVTMKRNAERRQGTPPANPPSNS